MAVALFVPSGVTELGVTEQVAADGAPLQDRETLWLKPPSGPTVSVYCAVCPAVTVADDEFFESEKSSMLKVTPVDDPPPGVGLNTITWAVAPVEISLAEIEAVNCALLT